MYVKTALDAKVYMLIYRYGQPDSLDFSDLFSVSSFSTTNSTCIVHHEFLNRILIKKNAAFIGLISIRRIISGQSA